MTNYAIHAEGLTKAFGKTQALNGVDLAVPTGTVLGVLGPNGAGRTTAKTYSGGMRRRLDLAASLIARPAVIFLDEPTTGRDPGKRDDVWQIIRNLTDAGTSVLLTTQHLEEADALADRISVIDEGKVMANGTPDELKQIVGTRSLQVRPADLRELADVRAVLARVTGREVEEPVRDVIPSGGSGSRAV